MDERMLNKQVEPTIEQMADHCGKQAQLFTFLNDWLSDMYGTLQKVTFPYGNKYGWAVNHRIKQKLICNIFAEKDAFTVMVGLSNFQFETIYEKLNKYTQDYIDDKYSCGDGGWIHYQVTCNEHFDDIKKILTVKCGK